MLQGLLENFINGDMRAAGRLISLVENGDPRAWHIMQFISQYTGNAYIMGITGPPGAGKSTTVDKLISIFRKHHNTVGVVCVDPTSPFTGGAFLGDRIRMQRVTGDENVFIRSLANRGALGGLAPKAKEVVQILDAFGMEVIIVETVGAGQVEADIINLSDTTIVVTVPGLGDQIQALKAGILEIADLLVVNKADREGASDTVRDLNTMLDWMPPEKWRPKVLSTVATRNQGIGKVYEAIQEHKNHLLQTGKWGVLRRKRIESHCFTIMENVLREHVDKKVKEVAELKELLEQAREGKLDPYSSADNILKILFSQLENKWALSPVSRAMSGLPISPADNSFFRG